MRVNMKLLYDQLVVEDLLPQVFINQVASGENIQDHLLLLLHRALDAQDRVQLIDMEVDGLRVVEGVEVQVELVRVYVLFGVLELQVQELH